MSWEGNGPGRNSGREFSLDTFLSKHLRFPTQHLNNKDLQVLLLLKSYHAVHWLCKTCMCRKNGNNILLNGRPTVILKLLGIFLSLQ